MSTFFGFLSVLAVCSTIFGLVFVVVLALPQSRMRDVMKKALMAVGCIVYVISPVDLMPEALLGPIGLIDDLGALLVGIASAREALRLSAN